MRTGFQVPGSRFRVPGSGFRVPGSGSKFQVLVLRALLRPDVRAVLDHQIVVSTRLNDCVLPNLPELDVRNLLTPDVSIGNILIKRITQLEHDVVDDIRETRIAN
jgi:hypothetical protein